MAADTPPMPTNARPNAVTSRPDRAAPTTLARPTMAATRRAPKTGPPALTPSAMPCPMPSEKRPPRVLPTVRTGAIRPFRSIRRNRCRLTSGSTRTRTLRRPCIRRQASRRASARRRALVSTRTRIRPVRSRSRNPSWTRRIWSFRRFHAASFIRPKPRPIVRWARRIELSRRMNSSSGMTPRREFRSRWDWRTDWRSRSKLFLVRLPNARSMSWPRLLKLCRIRASWARVRSRAVTLIVTLDAMAYSSSSFLVPRFMIPTSRTISASSSSSCDGRQWNIWQRLTTNSASTSSTGFVTTLPSSAVAPGTARHWSSLFPARR